MWGVWQKDTGNSLVHDILLTVATSFHLLRNKFTLVLTVVYGPIQFLSGKKLVAAVCRKISRGKLSVLAS